MGKRVVDAYDLSTPNNPSARTGDPQKAREHPP